MFYVYAYKIGMPRHVCVLDMLNFLPKSENNYSFRNNISVEIFKEKGRLFNTYPLISKSEFEAVHGKIEYP